MNKDRVKGTIDEVVGSAKRKAGGLTGNTGLQVEGMVQQAKGKLESALGKAEDAIHEANLEAEVKHKSRIEVELECAAIEDKQPRSK
jgi:uncharacterized protein YjbJ (UPF0337 family)